MLMSNKSGLLIAKGAPSVGVHATQGSKQNDGSIGGTRHYNHAQ